MGKKGHVLVPSGEFDPRSLRAMLLTTQGEFKDTFVKVHDKGALFQELKPRARPDRFFRRGGPGGGGGWLRAGFNTKLAA